ncbi:TPA: hypothetical protein ACKPX8_002528 [Serratia marcescens]
MSSEGLPVDGVIGTDIVLGARSTQQATDEAKSSLSADSAAQSADAAFKFSRQALSAATDAKEAAENVQNIADANTYYTTPEDPDGTIAGIAGTPDGKGFRVAQGGNKGFIYYVNESGVARQVASLPGHDALDDAVGVFSKRLDDSQFRVDALPDAVDNGDRFAVPNPVILKVETMQVLFTNRFVPKGMSLTASGQEVRSWYLPHLSMYRDGVLHTHFNATAFSELVFDEVAQTDDPLVRVRFLLPADRAFTPVKGMLQIFDLSGFFYPVSYDEVQVTPRPCASNHTTTGTVQFAIPANLVTAAGYNPSDKSSILSYVNQAAKNCIFLTYPRDEDVDNIKSYPQVSHLFQHAVGAGDYVVASSAGADVQFDVVALEKARPPKARGGATTRMIADIKNESAQAFNQHPMELRVNFKPGDVPDTRALRLSDQSGIEYPCQFAGEEHVNLRKQCDLSYHADGSLASGSVFFNATLAPGEQKFFQLQAHSFPMPGQTSSHPQLTWYDSQSLSLTVSETQYVFAGREGYKLAKIVHKGQDLSLGYTSHFVVLRNGNPISASFTRGVTIRVISSGSVFTEVEVTGYNDAVETLAERSLKCTTVYRIFTSGRVRVYTKFVAVKAIPIGVLYGAHCAFHPDLASGYAHDYKRKTILHSGTGHSIALLHTVHDVHRDGRQWGPDRTFWDSFTLNRANNGYFGFGWRYTSPDNYSFNNWPVDLNWAWSSESWIELNESLTDLNAITDRNYNRPVGYLGEGMWMMQARKSVLTAAGGLAESILDFLDSPVAIGIGGSQGKPDNRRPWTPYATHIYNHIRYGKRSLDDIWEDFKYRQYTSYGVSWITPNMGERYLAGKLLLQWAASDTILAMEWIYRLAERDGRTDITDSLKQQLISMGEGLVEAAEKQTTVKIPPLDGSMIYLAPSNSATISMRFLALAAYAGADTDGKFLALFESMESDLVNYYVFVENQLGDTYDNRPAAELWLAYTLWASYFYVSACRLLKRTPLTSLASIGYTLNATAGQGALRDIDLCNSESRRGKPVQWLNAVFLLLCADRPSATLAAKSIMENSFMNEWGPQPGYPGRFCGFLENTQNGPVPASDVPFLSGYAADLWLQFNF